MMHGNTTHGMSRTPEYRRWTSMKDRCFNPNNASYARYGGRGITVDPAWVRSFDAFYQDMGPRPGPEYSLERINNDGDYNKDNCRWATVLEQGANKHNNRLLERDGEIKHASEWAREYGISKELLNWRLKQGWDVSRALTTPARRMKNTDETTVAVYSTP